MPADRWEYIFELFDAALARPDAERAAFLAASCGDDAQLRDDVQSLLAAHREGDGFLSHQPRRSGEGPVSGTGPAPPSLTPGLRLGVFEIERFVGAGGMGEVYKAHDTRLERAVAIKVLSPDAATDPRRRARFAYEARAIARLSHPRICALHEMGHHDGLDFLVMEYLEGDTLAALLRKGPMRLMHALRTAVEIAAALAVAHAHGIVHRDLKPGNVMLTDEGAKLLDFGLARLRRPDGTIPSAPTTAASSSQVMPGLIAGTLQYMAPEQLEGKEADARSDIFAFGAVLYEMVTGRKAFEGSSQANIISAVLSADPAAVVTLQPLTPPAFDRVIRACLAKDRDDRWASAHDIRLQLEWIAQDASTTVLAAHAGASLRRRNLVLWPAAAAVAIAALAIWAPPFRAPPPDTPVRVLSVLPPHGSTFAIEEAPQISPDGRRLAFVGHDTAGSRLLYLRALDAVGVAQSLADTDGASMPFWSPDSRWLGFFAQGKLKKIEVATARIQTLADAPGPRGGTWSRDDLIVFVPNPGGGLYRLSASGGGVSPVATGTSPRTGSWYPSFLSDGQHFLFFGHEYSQPENAAVFVGSLNNGTAKRIVSARSGAIYATPGYLLFWRDGTLMAQAFDERTLEVGGNPVAVTSAAGLNPLINQGLFSVSASGTLVFFAGVDGESELVWTDRTGARIGKPGPRGVMNSMTLSPDDKSAVYDLANPRTGSIDLWRLDFVRGEPYKLTYHPAHDLFPLWSPDGARIAFTGLRELPPQLYELNAKSAGNENVLLKSMLPKVPSGWSEDGRLLLYTSIDPKSAGDIWALPLVGKPEPFPILRTAADERYGTLSPDGRWLAYISNETGTYQVYVEAFPATGFKRQVSTVGGVEPSWRRDGEELFYLAPNQTLMAVDVERHPAALAFGPPKPLFSMHITWMEVQAVARHYAPARDGQRFLISSATAEAQSAPMTVILNWAASLKH
jgi:eukaryotic-like serine/threonine-protein kinase